MDSFRFPTREEVTEYLQAKLAAFLHFAYNKEAKKYFGRNVTSWGKIGLFYLIFYGVVGGFFAIHLMLFVCYTPDPSSPGVRPRNFGKYAYPNFPNSRPNVLVIPRRIEYNGQNALMSQDDRNRYLKLVNSAREVGADPVCVNSTIDYGYAIRQPCALVHISKVFHWAPEAIIQAYLLSPYFDVQCTSDDLSRLNVSVRVSPPGIPLNLANNTGRRFPYNNQPNYIVPVMSVVFDLTNLALSAGSSASLTINCGLNVSSIPFLPTMFSLSAISNLYEVPTSASINMFLRN